MRDLLATIHGRSYQIPDMWLAGASQRLGSIHAAIEQWDRQAQLEAAWDREHAPSETPRSANPLSS